MILSAGAVDDERTKNAHNCYQYRRLLLGFLGNLRWCYGRLQLRRALSKDVIMYLPTTKDKMKTTRITLIHTNDSHTKLKSGDKGTLRSSRVDPFGDRVISVDWDSGSSLSLIEGEDLWSEEEVTN